MDANMILIMVDELGDEVEVDRFTIGNDLDEDYIEIWKDTKIEKAREQYPEAQGFYIEDRRNWNAMIYKEMHGDYDPWEDEDYEEEDEEWDEEDDYASNMPCDNTGFCAGSSCSRFYQCQA